MKAVNKLALGNDVQRAIAEFKTNFQRGAKFSPNKGKELHSALRPGQGGRLVEYYVGVARQTDPQGRAGTRRLVVHIEAGKIQRILFSENHYLPGSWSEVLGW